MRTMTAVLLGLGLCACDPRVTIGEEDAGVFPVLGGGTGGGGTSATGGGSGGGSTGDVCSHLAAAQGSFFGGLATCTGTSVKVTERSTLSTSCQAGLSSCTTGDRATLETLASCLEQTPRCTSPTDTTAVSHFVTCSNAAVAALTPSCRVESIRHWPNPKRIFITRATFNGNLGGLTGADAKCTLAAETAGYVGTWKAWLSTASVNAIDRLVDVGPWRDAEGTTIFADKTAMSSGRPATTLWYDENGGFLATDRVWTGTGYHGRHFGDTCAEWTASDMSTSARIGQVGRGDEAWTSFSSTSCDQRGHLVCVEQ